MTNILDSSRVLRRAGLAIAAALAMVVGMNSAALAMSQACSDINSEWGAGRSFAPAAGSSIYSWPSYDGVEVGETLRWTYSSWGSHDGLSYVRLRIFTTGGTWLAFENAFGNVADVSGSHTVEEGDNPESGITVEVDVSNEGGDLGNSAVLAITCTEAVVLPTLTSATPSSGPVAGGTAVTLIGTQLAAAESVEFGGVAGTGLAIHGDTSITVTTPGGVGAGNQAVRVLTPSGEAALPGGFTFIAEAPKVTSVGVPARGYYRAGQSLVFTVHYDAAVVVSGVPQIALSIGSAARTLDYVSGSGTNALRFSYTVQDGDFDDDGVSISGAFVPLGWSIRDLADTVDAAPSLNAVGSLLSVKVDAVAPVALSSEPDVAPDTTKSIVFKVGFSEEIYDFSTAAFLLETTGTATGRIEWVTNGSSSIRGQIEGIKGFGTLKVNVHPGGGIKDIAGNDIVSAFTSGTVHNVAVPVAPDAPAIGAVTAGDAEVSVAFTPPADDGGSTITGYTVTSSPGGKTGTGTSSPIIVSGLTNGTEYTFTVTANNAEGESLPSDDSAPATPLGVPGAPGINMLAAQDGGVLVGFVAPANDGGSPITGYTITSDPDGIEAGGDGVTTNPMLVSGLTNGTSYTFTVAAHNALGRGPESAASAAVTPREPLTITPSGALPDAIVGRPYSMFLTASGHVGVPTFEFASAYPAALSLDPTTGELSGTLTDSGTFYLYVAVSDELGRRVVFQMELDVSFAAPGVPTISAVTAGDEEVSVAFIAPVDEGSSAVRYYTVTSNPDGRTVSGESSPLVVTGLRNGTAYTFSVTASNETGVSQPSDDSEPVTPMGGPDAPVITGVTPGDRQVSVAFTPPEDDGGADVTGYVVKASPGGRTAGGRGTVTSPIIVDGLANGTEYTFIVTAMNDISDGVESAPSEAVTPRTVPGAPTIGQVTTASGIAVVGFTPPTDDGGAVVTSYTVTSDPDGLTSAVSASPATVRNLRNGESYTFKVVASNEAGDGPPSTASAVVVPVRRKAGHNAFR